MKTEGGADAAASQLMRKRRGTAACGLAAIPLTLSREQFGDQSSAARECEHRKARARGLCCKSHHGGLWISFRGCMLLIDAFD